MKKKNLLEILCSYTPQELQEYIQSKGKQKMVNVFSYIPKDNTISEMEKEEGGTNE